MKSHWLIRTPDKVNNFVRSAGILLNELLLYTAFQLDNS